MKSQFLNQIVPSFMLFLDHEILQQGQAYTNYSGQLYQTTDSDFSQFNVIGSPFRQWVSDSSIVGATIPSGVYSNGNYIPKVSGLALDYGMGRVITPLSFNPPNLTVNYAFKDLNVYYTDSREEKILFNTQYSLLPQNNFQAVSALNAVSRPYPCIYVKLRDSINEPYAFGGLDSTDTSIRTIIIADSNGLLDGTLSILNDTARKCFSIIPNAQLPFTAFGDYKNTSFNYNQLNAINLTGANVTYIDKVLISKFDSIINKDMGDGVFAAFADFNLSNIRSPRKY